MRSLGGLPGPLVCVGCVLSALERHQLWCRLYPHQRQRHPAAHRSVVGSLALQHNGQGNTQPHSTDSTHRPQLVTVTNGSYHAPVMLLSCQPNHWCCNWLYSEGELPSTGQARVSSFCKNAGRSKLRSPSLRAGYHQTFQNRPLGSISTVL